MTVAASVDGSSEIPPCARSGSKDDGTQQQRIVAAPSDSEPRTGRPARLNTWEFAAVVATTLPLLRPSFSVPFSPDECHPVSIVSPVEYIYIYIFILDRSVCAGIVADIFGISRVREREERRSLRGGREVVESINW